MNIYLAGEIHSNWRDELINLCKQKELDYTFSSPQLDHGTSDNVGKVIMGDQGSSFYNDNASAKINSIKTHISIQKSDIVIVKFGEQYKQWNAAFDAGYASALGKKLIIIHPQSFNHPLKEIDSVSSASVETEAEVVEILEYLKK
ncbi:YtoQ family protein [Arcobacter roscoffensis]|uniref:YtoQ family protein n=1 Tax=Arcobacter roscoffensis TaxID=2961520 RepID=A0ABY5E3B6_9BACT|nr:YtoQ family protein [Arcobacter roscoffensis]UTJ06367.1 YtoQ family protein [Arcobacter roscoffensis]